MPLNVRRFTASAAFTLLGFVLADAQTAPPINASPPQTGSNTASAPKIAAPTSAEIMRERISKAKAFIAVRNFNAAIYELENIRRETGDQTVHGVVNVLLMNSYLEQSDYKRAQEFLKELYNQPKSGKPMPSAHYFAVAGQVVKGARNQLDRYKSLGLTVSDRNLPLEATVDLEKMRETLEIIVEHSKTIGKEKEKTASAMALLEEATNSRGNLAKDDYDARRWKDEVGDAREQLMSPRSVITNAVMDSPAETPVSTESAAAINPPAGVVQTNPQTTETSAVLKPVTGENSAIKSNTADAKPAADSVAKNNTANNPEKINETPKPEPRKTDDAAKSNEAPKTSAGNTETARNNTQPNRENTENKAEKTGETQNAKVEAPADGSPLKVGSLITYATNQAKPVYPMAAKNMRMTGVVKVEVLVNENGEVTEVQNTTGPSMLQRAAMDAVKKWKFKPFVRDGQPVKASGFVNFNFSL